ncbi:hypothetical protein GTY75_22975 [Streptomyces sp. SID8381]|uniref:hypothetical protein n=1 Tax=unclassified Streptomyces TaxID=2593676 RepID=UPI000380D42D|nr:MULTISPECIES: hypothetical protein [unclassified Streptomyces]MYX29465.1 hypothetical protein [Streptomyces sp. SID8381]
MPKAYVFTRYGDGPEPAVPVDVDRSRPGSGRTAAAVRTVTAASADRTPRTGSRGPSGSLQVCRAFQVFEAFEVFHVPPAVLGAGVPGAAASSRGGVALAGVAA